VNWDFSALTRCVLSLYQISTRIYSILKICKIDSDAQKIQQNDYKILADIKGSPDLVYRLLLSGIPSTGNHAYPAYF